ncbi:serine/threonine protein kinase [Ktedonobacteria bacterium brp13]|nr:serine/threonine protein kinase [Ktedonobacteria bacterium brp13]
MSEVFMADDEESQKRVAVKLLYGSRRGEEAQQFLTKTAAIAELHHPHIMPILDYGIEDEAAFIVMEYTPYGDLRQRHPKGAQLDLITIIEYVQQISKALQYIHEKGYVHRDVKPHNLLIGEHNELLLSDFGTSILSHSLNPLHSTKREFEGTAPYAAPEQLRGKSRRSSDQYALGIMVYEWITGDWPFNGSFYEITHQHLFVAPPPLQKRGISYPQNIEQVLMRALEKEPTQRFPSIKRFAEELEWSYKIAQARGQLPSPAENKQSASVQDQPLQKAQRAQPLRQQFRSPLPFHQANKQNN